MQLENTLHCRKLMVMEISGERMSCGLVFQQSIIKQKIKAFNYKHLKTSGMGLHLQRNT